MLLGSILRVSNHEKAKLFSQSEDISKRAVATTALSRIPFPYRTSYPYQKARCFCRLSECPLRALEVITEVTSHLPGRSMNLSIERQDRFWNMVHVQRKQSGTLLSLAIHLVYKSIVHFDEHLSHCLGMLGYAEEECKELSLSTDV